MTDLEKKDDKKASYEKLHAAEKKVEEANTYMDLLEAVAIKNSIDVFCLDINSMLKKLFLCAFYKLGAYEIVKKNIEGEFKTALSIIENKFFLYKDKEKEKAL